MATSDLVNGTRLTTFLTGVSKYVNDIYFNLSGDTMKANLTMNNLYTRVTSYNIGEKGSGAKYIVFNTPSTASNGEKIHNCSIASGNTDSVKGIGLYDGINEIWPFYCSVVDNRIYTQCPWRQDFITVLGASETASTTVGTSATVLPMTRSANDGTDLNMLSISGNGVKANRACLVEISARVYFGNLPANTHANVWIHESGEGYTVVSSSVQGHGDYTAVSISPIPVWLLAGAVVTLRANVNSGSASVNESHTYMTVKVIGGALN